MTALLSQFGVAKETTWATPVTVSRFFEFTSEGVKPVVGRVESKGIRAGARAFRNDRSQPVAKGASGSVEFEVPTKGFGFWLEHMFGGSVVTVGPTDANYTHTATIGSLSGKGLTASEVPFFRAFKEMEFDGAGTEEAFVPSLDRGKVFVVFVHVTHIAEAFFEALFGTI
jgi:hypothetical protein